MKTIRIALLDSGVGGLSVLALLKKHAPNVEYIYFGDNENSPYGNRTENDLLLRTISNVEYLQSFNIDGIVIACNTISISILGQLKEICPIPIFGVFPPIIKTSKENSALLLATPVTAKKYLNLYGEQPYFDVMPLPFLAKDIERNNRVDVTHHLINVNKQYNMVILGCTHYFFVKNEIFDHLKPKKIISGNEFTVKQVIKFYEIKKTLDNYNEKKVLFVGKNSKINEKFWNKVVFKTINKGIIL